MCQVTNYYSELGVLSGTSVLHEVHRQSRAKLEPTRFKLDLDTDMKENYLWIVDKPSF